jgi:TonB family protein
MIKRILSVLPLSVACATVMHGQAICGVMTRAGDIYPIAGALGVIPKALEGGKLVEMNPPYHVLLKGTKSYADGYIKFEDFRVDPVFDENGTPDDKDFILKGTLVSDRNLQSNFLLFEFEADPGNPSAIVIAEAPDLTSGVRTTLRLKVPQDPTLRLQERNYYVHFFSGIHEHVTSLMPDADQAVAKTRTDAEILANTADRPLKVVLPVAPDWPSDIPTSVEGNATIRWRVGTDGLVLEASVVKATNPEFGANAVAAVKEWLFAPAIKNHEYVETTAETTLNFVKPKPKPVAAPAAPPAPAAPAATK